MFSLLTRSLLLWSAYAASPSSAASTSCGSDVTLLRKIGAADYNDNPITIISQSSSTNEVTFQISQEWQTDLSRLFVRFQDEKFTFAKCHAFEYVNTTWNSEPLTAICTKNSKIALVEVWASDMAFSVADDVALLPDCSCDTNADDLPLPMVKYVFQVECVSTCAQECPTTRRMLGSESD